MKLIGFNFNKISGNRFTPLKKGYTLSNNIEFTDVKEHKVEFIANAEAVEFYFEYILSYLDSDTKKESKFAEIQISGSLVFTVSKDESKNIFKAWKKKEISPEIKVGLLNLIMQKTSPKSIAMQENLSLPLFFPPKVQLKAKEN